MDKLPTESDSPTAGADIDAVGAISSKPPDTTVSAGAAERIICFRLSTIRNSIIIVLLIAGAIGLYLFKKRKGK